MSAPHLDDLARRAVACKRWRWMPGMRYQVGLLASRLSDSQCKGKLPLVAEARPDLTDPATLGCLLALVREAWGQGVYLLPDGGWYVKGARLKGGDTINLGIRAATEAEALVAALEAAQ
jgi:hypothetical protein